MAHRAPTRFRDSVSAPTAPGCEWRARRHGAVRRCALSLSVIAGACTAAPPNDAATTGTDVPPGTDIWVASLTASADGTLVLGSPTNATHRDGYDNQPHFLPDAPAFLYTVIDEAGQADIWRYDLVAGRASRVTHTAPESEYSATPLPGGGGFSAVRVEADSTQRLWRFDMDGTAPAVVLESVFPVGYHAWTDDHTLALFVLGDPPTLQVADANAGTSVEVAAGIGRSIQRIPGTNAVSFVLRTSPEESRIMRLEPGSEPEFLVATPGGEDDHAWTPDGTLLLTRGSTVLWWRPGGGVDGWTEVADLTAHGITLSRLAVSPDGGTVALVGQAISEG
ncbi:MAG: hypothetical protein OEZ65_11065 [Gemmatimonadota bacterium]|nr:hypothetical protein [Gemmatimonadota bacterium]